VAVHRVAMGVVHAPNIVVAVPRPAAPAEAPVQRPQHQRAPSPRRPPRPRPRAPPPHAPPAPPPPQQHRLPHRHRLPATSIDENRYHNPGWQQSRKYFVNSKQGGHRISPEISRFFLGFPETIFE